MRALLRAFKRLIGSRRQPASQQAQPAPPPTQPRRPAGLAPNIVSAEPMLPTPIDVGSDHQGMLLGKVLAAGPIQYNYIFAVSRRDDGQPCFWVTSERPRSGNGPPFLGMFHDDRHHNMGLDDRWRDVGSFQRAAVQLAEDFLAPEGDR